MYRINNGKEGNKIVFYFWKLYHKIFICILSYSKQLSYWGKVLFREAQNVCISLWNEHQIIKLAMNLFRVHDFIILLVAFKNVEKLFPWRCVFKWKLQSPFSTRLFCSLIEFNCMENYVENFKAWAGAKCFKGCRQ